MGVEYVDMDVLVKFGDSRSSFSRYIREAHFMMDDERRTTPAIAGNHVRQNATLALRLTRNLPTGGQANAAPLKFYPKLSQATFSAVCFELRSMLTGSN